MIFSSEIQPMHAVEESPWPLIFSISIFSLIISFVDFFYTGEFFFFFFNFILQCFIFYIWSKDIFRESSLQGSHGWEVEKGLKWGMSWFIMSEIFFFVSFFWGFFHFSLSPSFESGSIFPPLGVQAMDYSAIPLLNTIILLSSGISLTWFHHSLIANNFMEATIGINITILLGIYFTGLQIFEYSESSFSFNDACYGSVFFIATGFHGCHVIIGTLFLFIVSLRLLYSHFSSTHHIGVEISSWYWHFVDVVWLFLFCCVYWWGS